MTPMIVLQALIRHETLTFPDLLLEKNLGIALPEAYVETALQQLRSNKLVDLLNDTDPPTYTITAKGIEEGQKASEPLEKLV
jgi:hypothetical protein